MSLRVRSEVTLWDGRPEQTQALRDHASCGGAAAPAVVSSSATDCTRRSFSDSSWSDGKACSSAHIATLLFVHLIPRTHLTIQQKQGFLVVLGQTRDDKHALASFIMCRLGNRDPRPRQAPDLVDLGAATSDDATTIKVAQIVTSAHFESEGCCPSGHSHHVIWDRNFLLANIRIVASWA